MIGTESGPTEGTVGQEILPKVFRSGTAALPVNGKVGIAHTLVPQAGPENRDEGVLPSRLGRIRRSSPPRLFT